MSGHRSRDHLPRFLPGCPSHYRPGGRAPGLTPFDARGLVLTSEGLGERALGLRTIKHGPPPAELLAVTLPHHAPAAGNGPPGDEPLRVVCARYLREWRAIRRRANREASNQQRHT